MHTHHVTVPSIKMYVVWLLALLFSVDFEENLKPGKGLFKSCGKLKWKQNEELDPYCYTFQEQLLISLHYQYSLKYLESPNKNWIIRLENAWPWFHVTPSFLQFEATSVRTDPCFMFITLKQKQIHHDGKSFTACKTWNGRKKAYHKPLLTSNCQIETVTKFFREKIISILSSCFGFETPMTPSERW